MANIKWSGIEKSKYGLTAKWYVSAYYGDDNDTDGVGLYNASTNPTGHGGPTRPFASSEKVIQTSTSTSDVIVFDSGFYSYISASRRLIVGDGHVIFDNNNTIIASQHYFYNVNLIRFKHSGAIGYLTLIDCQIMYSVVSTTSGTYKNSVFVESTTSNTQAGGVIENVILLNCTGSYKSERITNIKVVNSPLFTFGQPAIRASGAFVDYSCIIGTVKSSYARNGKTTDVTIEDFKADGNYFVKSYSEVDLWGNASGSGASVVQLQELFCNYFSPIYIDTWNEANFHLKPNAPDILKYGGLNGTYIGAKPIMHWFSSETLWDTYRDAANTTDLEKDIVSKAILISGAAESGTYRSIRISLPKPITANIAKFAANLVYNIEGTVKQGVSNQRIDTTPDLLPDNTANQRVVYDFKLATSANNVDALSAFKNYELDREPTVDSQGRSHLDDAFDSGSEAKQTIQDFMVEFTLRKVVIE